MVSYVTSFDIDYIRKWPGVSENCSGQSVPGVAVFA